MGDLDSNSHAVISDKGITLLLDGLNCAACVLKVERALQRVPNVQQAHVNLAEKTAFVMGHVSPDILIQAVMEAGYHAEFIDNEENRRIKQQTQAALEIWQRKWQSAVALILGFGLLIWGLAGGQTQVTAENQMNWLAIGGLTFAVMWLTGGHFYRNAWHSLLNATATMDTLIAIGTGAAWLFSMIVVLLPSVFPDNARHLYFESSAMIIGLINLGKMLEAKAKRRSSQALSRLLNLTPKNVVIIDEHGEREIALANVQKGMILRLKTGDRVSVDGIVIKGEAWLDESALTGESIPVQKTAQAKVRAGELITDGTILLQAEQIGNQTSLARIIQLVRQAQSSKPQLAHLADKIAAIFVPVVMVIAIVAALIWYLATQDISYAFTVFTTVLIIACPCALGLATPMSIIASVGRAAELGILVRNADALQHAASADTIVFDKTGTLTQGTPTVSAIHTVDIEEKQAIYLAASLEQGTNHPLAKAILAIAPDKLANVQHFTTLKGLGVRALIEGKTVVLGNQTLMAQLGIDISAVENWSQQESRKGATVVFLAVGDCLVALFAIRDELRKDTVSALQRLRQQGYHLVMLTGDQHNTAQAIAQESGIAQVIAGVLPEGKAQVIEQLQKQGRHVVMVGDGINDAPALAQADVGIAMGSGTDIALETAELTLMRHSIHGVADALSLVRGTLKNMRQNLFFAFFYNCLGIPLAAGLFYPLFGVLLNPMIGGAAMALSSITVATNANRLLKFSPKSWS